MPPKITVDLTGEKFGRWTVLHKAFERKNTKGYTEIYWKCKCDCGTERDVYQNYLLRGSTLSCGCLRLDKIKESSKDFSGMTFGKLTVLYEGPSRRGKDGKLCRRWWCKCSCGNIKLMLQSSLETGAKSCGCWVHNKPKMIKYKSNSYELCDNYYKGYLEDDSFFIIDKEDFDKVSKYYWARNKNGYICCSAINGAKTTMLHNFVLERDSSIKNVVDHINGNKSDNRKCNLRIVTQQENGFNRKIKSTNSSGVTGVCWDADRQKWMASIGFNYRHIHLGRFDNKEDAIAARKAAEEKYYGEYSYDASQELAEKSKIKEEQKEQ